MPYPPLRQKNDVPILNLECVRPAHGSRKVQGACMASVYNCMCNCMQGNGRQRQNSTCQMLLSSHVSWSLCWIDLHGHACLTKRLLTLALQCTSLTHHDASCCLSTSADHPARFLHASEFCLLDWWRVGYHLSAGHGQLMR